MTKLYDNHYWCITDVGRVECHCLDNESKDRRMAIGNYFRSREEALAMVEKLKRMQTYGSQPDAEN